MWAAVNAEMRARCAAETAFPGNLPLSPAFVVAWPGAIQGGFMSEPQTPQVQIKAEEAELLGQYSNLVMIHHNPEEFTLHFIYLFTNGTHGKLVSSLILSPGHAKRLWRALGENISRFETQFGPIRETLTPAPPSNVGFVQ
jgi:hypothetical protein